MGVKVTLAFVGDVMLGRGVNEEIEHHAPEYFWGTTLPVLHSADAVITNLECAITNHTMEWQGSPKAFYFRASPKAVDVLRVANIRCVSLANNHILDFEEQGLLDTLQCLDEADICYAGAGKNLDEARMPAIMDVNGTALAIIGATDNEPDFAANANPGTNYIEIATDTATLPPLEQEIASARQMGAKNIILSLHWGPNMVASPPQRFRDFAHAVTDLGVDILHGHSAHIFQAVEAYKRGLIMYDTGDFIDDYAIDPVLRNDWSFIFLVSIDAEGPHSLKMLPVVLSYAQVNLATGTEFRVICDRMKHLCERFNTRVIDVPQGLEIPP
ncbi:MAG TPA: CapA family protein [Candidatus Aquicultor sp.]|jgi:poly-gamma-glutamate synthesis protein (capsule biosynthesis protein)